MKQAIPSKDPKKHTSSSSDGRKAEKATGLSAGAQENANPLRRLAEDRLRHFAAFR